MQTIKPPTLKPGDTIGIMAPSSLVEQEDINKSTTLLESKGYNVFVHPQTYERDNSSAGTHLQKTLALQGLWQRDDIKAIWCAGGGNRSLHLLESINFEAMEKKPKIFIGFSDITSLLGAIHAHTGIITYHGPVFKDVHEHNHGQLDQLLNMLSGEKSNYPLDDAIVIRAGKADGPLIGGNLSLFQYLPKTLPGEFWQGSLLFLEDCNEELSRIDRMLMQLRRLGVLEQTSGLIFGEFSNMRETGSPFGFTLEDIIRQHTEALDIPVIINAPFGHGNQLFTFPIGIKASLDTEKKSLKLCEKAVL